MTNAQRHHLIGIFALLLFGVFVFIWCTAQMETWGSVAKPAFRTGFFLTLAWLAWDDLCRLPRSLAIVLPIVLIGIIIRPKMIPYMLVVILPIWFFFKFLNFLVKPVTPDSLPPPKK